MKRLLGGNEVTFKSLPSTTADELVNNNHNIREKIKCRIISVYIIIKKVCHDFPPELCIEILNCFTFTCMDYDCYMIGCYIPLHKVDTMIISTRDFEIEWRHKKTLGAGFEDYCVCDEHEDLLVKCKDCDYRMKSDDVFTRGSEHLLCYECGEYICDGCAIPDDYVSDTVNEYSSSLISGEEAMYCKECVQY